MKKKKQLEGKKKESNYLSHLKAKIPVATIAVKSLSKTIKLLAKCSFLLLYLTKDVSRCIFTLLEGST